jgi:phosphoglucosamine mutase
VGEPPIVPEFIMKLGWAAGRVLARSGRGPVLIGKDTRISGYLFESALEAGLSAAGVDVTLLGPMPTPGIAFLTRNTRSQAGIVISASHNPYYDNGIKFFAADGTKLPDAVEAAIEAELELPLQTVAPERLGKARRIADAPRRYIEFCKSRVGSGVDFSGLRLVVDCAHGAAYRIAPRVFEELGATVQAIGVQPDGLNINRGFGATDLGNLQRAVLESGADAGIALDGDGDRLMLVDHLGEAVDGDQSLYIIARAAATALNGGVVGTQMSNLGLELALRALGLEFHRARVGDRHVMETLQQRGLTLGGESSGHIINLNLTIAGDGIISALQVLEAMRATDRPLNELKRGMHKFPQRLINLDMPREVDPETVPEIADAVRDAESQLGAGGRVLLRPSGTEPLLRIMIEGEDPAQVDRLVQALAERVGSVLGVRP